MERGYIRLSLCKHLNKWAYSHELYDTSECLINKAPTCIQISLHSVYNYNQLPVPKVDPLDHNVCVDVILSRMLFPLSLYTLDWQLHVIHTDDQSPSLLFVNYYD